jgi:Holliday junction resolvase RusA-like endonuclease
MLSDSYFLHHTGCSRCPTTHQIWLSLVWWLSWLWSASVQSLPTQAHPFSPSSRQHDYVHPSQILLPLMEPSVPLEAVITFRIRRPNSHFVNSKRNRGLRTKAPRTYVVGKLDLDNLVKFTLDAIGGVIYVTDGQICYISCRKVWDEGQGSTTCVVSKLEV